MREEGPRPELDERTTDFAVRVVRVYCALPQTGEADVVGRQMLRSGTSVGAQWREAKRARSDAEFISKLASAHQELDETIYWFDLLVRTGILSNAKLSALRQEANELSAIFTTILRNMKHRR